MPSCYSRKMQLECNLTPSNSQNLTVSCQKIVCQQRSLLSVLFCLKDGTAPLWIASQMGHSEVVRVMLLRGADRDATRNVSSFRGNGGRESLQRIQGHTQSLWCTWEKGLKPSRIHWGCKAILMESLYLCTDLMFPLDSLLFGKQCSSSDASGCPFLYVSRATFSGE